MVGAGVAGAETMAVVGVACAACWAATAFSSAFERSGPANMFQNGSTDVIEMAAMVSCTSVHLRGVGLAFIGFHLFSHRHLRVRRRLRGHHRHCLPVAVDRGWVFHRCHPDYQQGLLQRQVPIWLQQELLQWS